MKRRVSCHYTMSDEMLNPYCYVNEYTPGEIRYNDPSLVLRDEELWQRLLDAQKALQVAEDAVQDACIYEPLDEVERECGLEMARIMNRAWNQDGDQERFEACRERLRKHAEES